MVLLAVEVVSLQAYHLRGLAARADGESLHALDDFDQALRRCEEGDLEWMAMVARVMVDRAAVLRDVGRTTEALSEYDEVVAQFTSVADPVVERAVAVARRGRAELGTAR